MNDLSKIEEIYHAALEKSPSERDYFLKKFCGDNRELRREVESLLSFEEKAESFIETPPEDLAADLFEKRDENRDIIGKTLHHYRILSLLGEGGMGEVYLAEDTKLGRKLAVKLLPTQFSGDDERKQRFLREARAVSALNHPNIITVHGIEETDEHDFIVTEFIDGQTLREKISENPLDWHDALDIAVQIADALESAHEIGIVHRDIKPANIMIRRDGYIKILDFGLAKMTNRTNYTDNFKTIDKTGNRRVMGTMNYMSPEQTLGETVDSRTDIFSFGVVLYEMLSGIQPFAGASDAAVYNATINTDPTSLSEIKPDVPPAFEQIIKRAIEKNANERYQTVSEMRSDLQTLKQHSASDISGFKNYSFQKPRWTKIFMPIAAAVAAILISTAVFYFYFNGTSETKNLQFTQLTNDSGEELFPSLSPDGKTVIYSSGKSGNQDIYFQRVGGSNAVNLTPNSTMDDKQAVYSPDGEQIAFRSERDGGGIFVMGATGESVRRITDFGYYPSWSPDGKQIVFASSDFTDPTDRAIIPTSLWIVNTANGERRELTKGDAMQPSWSPTGHRIAFWSVEKGGVRDIKTISADGGEPVSVTDDSFVDWNPVWSPDGKYLYFSSNRGGSMNLWRVQINEQTGEILNQPEQITTPAPFFQHISFSRDGKQFAFVQLLKSSNIVKYDFDSQTEVVAITPTEITSGAKINRNPNISPDGEWIAFDAINNKQEDLFIMRRDGGDVRQLTDDKYNDRAPVWSPDGKNIVFYSDRSGSYEGWIINRDGGGLQQVTKVKDDDVLMLLWSPDGEKLLYNTGSGFPFILETDKLSAEQTPQALPRNAAKDRWIMATSWSPDGKKIAAGKYGDDPNFAGINVYHIASKKYLDLTDYGEVPLWLNDNRRLIFMDATKIYLMDTATKQTKEILSVAPNNLQMMAISPDNRSIYVSVIKNESDIWLANVE